MDSNSHEYDPEVDHLLCFALNRGVKALSERVLDTIPELSGVATSFLEAVGVFDAEKHSVAFALVDAGKHSEVVDAEKHLNNVANAEKHFKALHEFWMHKDFVPLLYKVSSNNGYIQLLCLTNVYARDTSFRLQQLRVKYIRKDSTLKDILNETDPSLRLRAAISILIRYWCMENMLEEYFFRNIGLLALGLDISFAAAQEAPLYSEGEKEMFVGLPEKRAAGPTALAPESKRSRPTTMPLNEFSPIGQLVNVPSIQRLARDVSQHPKLVELAEKLLSSVEDAEYEQEPTSERKKHYLIHCEAMWDFWWNQDFCLLMRKHLLMDPHLFVMVKMFSDRFKREITMDQLQLINTSLLPKLNTFLDLGGLDLGKPEDRIRCAYSVMMRYWACVGVAMRLREKWKWKPLTKHGRPLTKYDADCKDQKDEHIGEVFHYPVHNDDPADCVLTLWYEANETEINHLLDKEWRDVLTRRYSRDEEETRSLLGKIDFDYTRLNLVLKNDSDGKLCMTCTKLTPVARTV